MDDAAAGRNGSTATLDDGDHQHRKCRGPFKERITCYWLRFTHFWDEHTADALTIAIVLVTTVAMVALLFWPSRWWWEPRTEVTCIPPQVAGPSQEETDSGVVIPLEVGTNQDPVLRFGRSRKAKAITIPLAMSAPEDTEAATTPSPLLEEGTQLTTSARPFQRADGAVIPAEAIYTSARVVGNQVDLTVCIHPMDPPEGQDGSSTTVGVVQADTSGTADSGAAAPMRTRFWDLAPGTYIGSVAVLDERVAPLTVQLAVTRSFVRWWSVAAIAVLSAMAGVVWLYLLRTTDDVDPDDAPFGNWYFTKWLSRRDSVISIATGLVGVSAVYTGTYLRAPDWGASSTAFLGFIGATFTAFITAASAGSLAGRGRHTQKKQRSRRLEGRPGRGGATPPTAQDAPNGPEDERK